MTPDATRAALIATALFAVACDAPNSPEPVFSAGGNLVERRVLDEVLVARRTLEVFEQPEREWLFPMFWKAPVPAGHVQRGEVVRVLGVKETYLWRDRLVWLQLQRTTAPNDAAPVWYRIGPQEWATSNLRFHWDRAPVGNPARHQDSR